MSHVYLAEDLKLKGKRWAVKECLPFAADSDMTFFLEEAEMLAKLQHPQLPQLVDYFINRGWKRLLGYGLYSKGQRCKIYLKKRIVSCLLRQIVHIAFQLCDFFTIYTRFNLDRLFTAISSLPMSCSMSTTKSD